MGICWPTIPAESPQTWGYRIISPENNGDVLQTCSDISHLQILPSPERTYNTYQIAGWNRVELAGIIYIFIQYLSNIYPIVSYHMFPLYPRKNPHFIISWDIHQKNTHFLMLQHSMPTTSTEKGSASRRETGLDAASFLWWHMEKQQTFGRCSPWK